MAPISGADPEPVSLQHVVARVSIRALEEGRSFASDVDDLEPLPLTDDESPSASRGRAAAFAVPWADFFPARGELARRLRSAGIEGGLAAAATWMFSQDERISLAGGVVVGVAALVRTLDRRISFSFGAGFVGYRSEMGWPQGVQEDDDVHWRWRPAEGGQVNQPS